MARNTKNLVVRIDSDLLEAFKKSAGEGNLSQSVRELISSNVGYKPKKEVYEGSLNTRLQVMVSEKDAEAIRKLSNDKGLTVSDILRRHLKIALDNEPFFLKPEIESLLESNKELRAIGRNLNQAVTALNAEGVKTDNPKVVLLKGVFQKVKKLKHSIDKLITASTNHVTRG